MNLLLDTHVLLWFLVGDRRLTHTARQQIETSENQRWLSIASLWEIAIKTSLGKLQLTRPFDELFPRQLEANAINLLSIQPVHLAQLTRLPFHHKDPFDRLLVAQAITEEMPLLSQDRTLDAYPVKRLW
jgi:PIN domain nuclease of toxin-antitoxin system